MFIFGKNTYHKEPLYVQPAEDVTLSLKDFTLALPVAPVAPVAPICPVGPVAPSFFEHPENIPNNKKEAISRLVNDFIRVKREL